MRPALADDQQGAPVHARGIAGGGPANDVRRRRGDAEAAVAASVGRKHKAHRANDANEHGRDVHIQRLGVPRLAQVYLRAAGILSAVVAPQQEGHDPQDRHQDPRRDMQRAVDGGYRQAPLLEPIIRPGQRARFHRGGGKSVKQQGNPRADQALGRAVPRAGSATTGQDDAQAEDEAADDDGYRFEIANFRRKHARASQ